jgi:hypothetical protein
MVPHLQQVGAAASWRMCRGMHGTLMYIWVLALPAAM